MDVSEPNCQLEPIDLTIVLGSSSSMQQPEWTDAKQFVMNVTKQLPIDSGQSPGSSGSRVGLVQFFNRVNNVFWMNRFTRKNDVLRGISRARKLGPGNNGIRNVTI